MDKQLPPWAQPFLQHLTVSGNMAESCRQAGVGYATMQALKAKDADFENAVDVALEQGYDYLEAECRRRAFEGVEDPVVYQGQLTPVWARDADGKIIMDTRKEIGPGGEEIIQHVPRQLVKDGKLQWLTVRKYSDSLAQFLLKGYRRRKFGDKTELTGADGQPLALVDETKKLARIAALVALATERKAKGLIPDLPADDDLSDLA